MLKHAHGIPIEDLFDKALHGTGAGLFARARGQIGIALTLGPVAQPPGLLQFL